MSKLKKFSFVLGEKDKKLFQGHAFIVSDILSRKKVPAMVANRQLTSIVHDSLHSPSYL